MTTKEMVLSLFHFRFKQEVGFVPLMDAIKELTAEQASWQPSKEGHSIWQIVNHLVYWNTRMLDQLEGRNRNQAIIENNDTFGNPGDRKDEAGWQSTMEQTYKLFEKMQEEVSKLDDSQFDKVVDDDGTTLKVVLGDMAMHDSYHIGQILYIRKLQGVTR
ncbi:DinB family protein [Virgibacillus oceani]